MKRLIRKEDERDLLLMAFRYALGRQSMAVSAIISAINYAWDDLDKHDKELIVKEIKRYDKYLGFSDIDKPAWYSIVERS